jgi:hypothetical protein
VKHPLAALTSCRRREEHRETSSNTASGPDIGRVRSFLANFRIFFCPNRFPGICYARRTSGSETRTTAMKSSFITHPLSAQPGSHRHSRVIRGRNTRLPDNSNKWGNTPLPLCRQFVQIGK